MARSHDHLPPHHISAGVQCELEIVLLGNHVQVNNELKGTSSIAVSHWIPVNSTFTEPV